MTGRVITSLIMGTILSMFTAAYRLPDAPALPKRLSTPSVVDQFERGNLTHRSAGYWPFLGPGRTRPLVGRRHGKG